MWHAADEGNMKNISGRVSTVLAGLALLSATPAMADPATAGPQFNERGELARPEDYRSWVFLNTALGLTYGPNRPPAGAPQVFTSVFVNPKAYAEFQKTGQWPDGTIFALEVAVRDSSRYPDGGWSYFSFDGPPDNRAALRTTAAPFARTASCYACHQKHGAVQWTFTQFYADAFERAQQLGTVRKDYDPARRIEDAGH